MNAILNPDVRTKSRATKIGIACVYVLYIILTFKMFFKYRNVEYNVIIYLVSSKQSHFTNVLRLLTHGEICI